MKHAPSMSSSLIKSKTMSADLLALRRVENFIPEEYVRVKLKLMGAYFKENRLDTAVVAISGGVDSACVLALLTQMKRQEPETLKKVIAVTLPAPKSAGVTNQPETVVKAKRLVEAFDIALNEVDMSNGIEQSLRAIGKVSDNPSLSPWAEGQVVPYLRTAWLYGITASLSDQGHRSVVMGTTNKDEGAYLGFFGKASDGLVDIQPISDLHKSQVMSVAAYLGVPSVILGATPTGDMYDNRTDEQVFGATYDEVEWAIRRMEKDGVSNAVNALAKWKGEVVLSQKEAASLGQAMKNIDDLHGYNRHKYVGGSPAVHLDVLPCRVRSGWKNNTNRLIPEEMPTDRSKWVNPCEGLPTLTKVKGSRAYLEKGPQGILKFKGVLSAEECGEWIKWAKQPKIEWLRANEYGKTHAAHARLGSWRKTTDAKASAEELYDRLCVLGLPRHYQPIHPESDRARDGLVWTRVGLSNVWRWIKYEKGDGLVPHYDDSFIHSSHKRTLWSVVIYLTEGETTFMSDPRFPTTYEDWSSANSLRVDYTVKANPGDVLVFDHRLFHSGPEVNCEKIIIRTDVIFEKPNLGGAIENH